MTSTWPTSWQWRRRGGREVADNRWLVVGLGNPEKEYGGTRHNVGAEALGALAVRLGTSLSANRRVRCAVSEAGDAGARLVLARPLAYMNESGGPVQQAAAWYKVPPERMIVLHDDLDLETATVRLKRGGGHAGHNGLRDIARRLGTADFHRVRIGIGRPPGRMDPADYVLLRFSAKERQDIDVALQEATDAVLGLVHDGLETTQNRIHRRR